MEGFHGYDGLDLVRLWPPDRFDKDTTYLPVLSDDDIVRLHEALAADVPPPPIV